MRVLLVACLLPLSVGLDSSVPYPDDDTENVPTYDEPALIDDVVIRPMVVEVPEAALEIDFDGVSDACDDIAPDDLSGDGVEVVRLL